MSIAVHYIRQSSRDCTVYIFYISLVHIIVMDRLNKIQIEPLVLLLSRFANQLRSHQTHGHITRESHLENIIH